MEDILNLGIFAHVDAGKTTLTECMLYHSGAIRALGAVDKGTAHTDALPIERARGISVKAAASAFAWNGRSISIIDTPGHADFSFEVERSIWALDAAVLVISAAEGVQAQTELIFEMLRRERIPTLIFINKMDRLIDHTLTDVIASIQRILHRACLPYPSDALTEEVCQTSEALMDAYLAGMLEQSAYVEKLKSLICECEIYPVVSGSALKDIGVEGAMDAIAALLPSPSGSVHADMSGIVFGFRHDKIMGRAATVRLYSGALKVREQLNGQKLTQIRVLTPAGWEDRPAACCGEIASICGAPDLRMGQVIGDAKLAPRRAQMGRLRQPLLMVELITPPADMTRLRQEIRELEREDPLLNADWSPYLQKLHVTVMGSMQLDVLSADLKERGLNVEFGPPQVMYRETIQQPAVGFVAYTMPKPCWAVIKLYIEPGARGSGVAFASTTPVRRVKPQYQHQVEQAIPTALKQGMLGWPVTDVVITMVDGEDHQFHTHPLDFVLATPMAVMDGLRRAGSQLLEPILDVRLTFPASSLGGVIRDMSEMRGEILTTQAQDELMTVIAKVPAATSMRYGERFAQLTGGRGVMIAQLSGYRQCELSTGAVCPRRSVNPLDTSKYILAARNALEATVWE